MARSSPRPAPSAALRAQPDDDAEDPAIAFQDDDDEQDDTPAGAEISIAPVAPPARSSVPPTPARAKLEGEPKGDATLYLTPYQLSKRWGWAIRPRTLQNWRSRKKGPKATHLGTNVVVYLIADVEAYEREQGGRIVR